PVIVWLFRWLLFRLMLLSGAVKLLSHDAAWRTLTALQFHYQTQPLPTPLAWHMHQLPAWFQEASVVVMFAIELVAPFLIFTPRRLRLIAGGCIVFLQIAILLTGNYTYFNWLAIALCVLLLDDPAMGAPAVEQRRRPRAVSYVAGAVATLVLLLSGSQLLAAFFQVDPHPMRAVRRILAPFYLVNTYGLFAVMTTVRQEIVVEGSHDG